MDIKTGLLLFTEGILAFISPCFLPMIPIYVSYLVGHNKENSSRKILVNGFAFIMGFTLIFVILGMSATSISKFLTDNRLLIMRIGGLVLIIMGLNTMEVLKVGFLNRDTRLTDRVKVDNFFSAFLFGIVIAFGWSPCLGSLLSVALLTASNASTYLMGGLMLLIFSLGLAIPFMLTALLLNNFTGIMTSIKKNYRLINIISGLFLIVIGLLMVTDKFMSYATVFY